MARVYKTKEGLTIFSNSAQGRIPLKRSYHCLAYMCVLTVVHTNSTAIFNDSPLLGLIKRIEIVADGNNTIKNLPSSKLFINSLLKDGKKGMNDIHTENGTELTSKIYFEIPMEMIGAGKITDTILNTSLFTTLDMIIDWGSDTTIGSGITVHSAKLEVSSNKIINYRRNSGETIKYFNETSLVQEVTNSTNELTINLPVNKDYRALTLLSSVDGKFNNNIIKNITLKSGSNTFINLDANIIRAENIADIKPFNNEDLKGIYYLDLCPRKYLSDMINTRIKGGFNTLELLVEVEKQEGGVNNIIVFSDTVLTLPIVESKS